MGGLWDWWCEVGCKMRRESAWGGADVVAAVRLRAMGPARQVGLLGGHLGGGGGGGGVEAEAEAGWREWGPGT
jgi:hypothetical protein